MSNLELSYLLSNNDDHLVALMKHPDADDMLYRMDGYATEEGITLVINKYPISKRTAKGVWINKWIGHKGRFVLLSAKKQYASKTKVEALNQFLHRKHRQHLILTSQLSTVKDCIVRAEKIKKENSF